MLLLRQDYGALARKKRQRRAAAVDVGVCQRRPGVRAARFRGDSISSARTQIRNIPHSREKKPLFPAHPRESLRIPAHRRSGGGEQTGADRSWNPGFSGATRGLGRGLVCYRSQEAVLRGQRSRGLHREGVKVHRRGPEISGKEGESECCKRPIRPALRFVHVQCIVWSLYIGNKSYVVGRPVYSPQTGMCGVSSRAKYLKKNPNSQITERF